MSPPEGVTPHLFYQSEPICPLFFVNLPTIFFRSVVTPRGCHPGGLPPLVTPMARKHGNYDASQLEAARPRASRSGLFLAKLVLRTYTNCYFPASDQNSDIAIRFSDPDFPKTATIRRSDDVSMLWPWPLTTWRWTSNTSGVMWSTTLQNVSVIEQSAAELLMI